MVQNRTWYSGAWILYRKNTSWLMHKKSPAV
jgi:hypothetical protein